ncbi:hypothetical protein HK102_010679 [Quaeritorhiza haematococci]|nr:hypothetical protein HK102_010679 [Quaeritorhiza haematococci]
MIATPKDPQQETKKQRTRQPKKQKTQTVAATSSAAPAETSAESSLASTGANGTSAPSVPTVPTGVNGNVLLSREHTPHESSLSTETPALAPTGSSTTDTSFPANLCEQPSAPPTSTTAVALRPLPPSTLASSKGSKHKDPNKNVTKTKTSRSREESAPKQQPPHGVIERSTTQTSSRRAEDPIPSSDPKDGQDRTSAISSGIGTAESIAENSPSTSLSSVTSASATPAGLPKRTSSMLGVDSRNAPKIAETPVPKKKSRTAGKGTRKDSPATLKEPSPSAAAAVVPKRKGHVNAHAAETQAQRLPKQQKGTFTPFKKVLPQKIPAVVPDTAASPALVPPPSGITLGTTAPHVVQQKPSSSKKANPKSTMPVFRPPLLRNRCGDESGSTQSQAGNAETGEVSKPESAKRSHAIANPVLKSPKRPRVELDCHETSLRPSKQSRKSEPSLPAITNLGGFTTGAGTPLNFEQSVVTTSVWDYVGEESTRPNAKSGKGFAETKETIGGEGQLNKFEIFMDLDGDVEGSAGAAGGQGKAETVSVMPMMAAVSNEERALLMGFEYIDGKMVYIL